jgi:hypothetical protein
VAHGKPPQFAILNHAAIDSGIPRESATQRLGISHHFVRVSSRPSNRPGRSSREGSGARKLSGALWFQAAAPSTKRERGCDAGRLETAKTSYTKRCRWDFSARRSEKNAACAGEAKQALMNTAIPVNAVIAPFVHAADGGGAALVIAKAAFNAFPVTDLRAMSDMTGLRCRFGDETSPREANRQIGSRFHHGTLC